MKWMFICSLCWLMPAFLIAQPAATVEHRTIQEQQWQDASGDLDYSRDVPKVKKAEQQPATDADMPSAPGPSPGIDTQLLGNIAQVLAILIAVFAIGYGIYRMLQEPSNKRIARDGAEITVENLETYLHETDLDRFLREALAKQDYSQAIRIYFLQIIKQLSQSGAIQWSKEKTNMDYLREMRSNPDFQSFRDLTHTFERCWFGNSIVRAPEFERMEPAFKNFIQRQPVS